MNEESEPVRSPAGWYRDPGRRYEHRYWDGIRWTDHVSSGGVSEVDTWPATSHDLETVVSEPSSDDAGGRPTVIVSKAANALVEHVSFQMPRLGEQALEEAGAEPRSVEWVLEQYRGHYGGLWVGGRAILTTASIKFAPNALNRATHTGALDVEIPLPQIERVKVHPGVVTKIVAVQTKGGTLKVRCYGAKILAEAIESARRI